MACLCSNVKAPTLIPQSPITGEAEFGMGKTQWNKNEWNQIEANESSFQSLSRPLGDVREVNREITLARMLYTKPRWADKQFTRCDGKTKGLDDEPSVSECQGIQPHFLWGRVSRIVSLLSLGGIRWCQCSDDKAIQISNIDMSTINILSLVFIKLCYIQFQYIMTCVLNVGVLVVFDDGDDNKSNNN